MRAPFKSPTLLPADLRGSAMIQSPVGGGRTKRIGSEAREATRARFCRHSRHARAMWHNCPMTWSTHSTPLGRAVLLVAGLNLGYFGIEFAVATAIGSVSLFAD